MVERDETAVRRAADLDTGTERPQRGRGLPGLAFNNPYLQRVYCGLDVLALARDFVSTLLGVIKNKGASIHKPIDAREEPHRQGVTGRGSSEPAVSMIRWEISASRRYPWEIPGRGGGDGAGAMRSTTADPVPTTEETYEGRAPTLQKPGNSSRTLDVGGQAKGP